MSETPTQERITRAERERLRALAEKATPGPWLTDERYPRKVYCDDVTGSLVADTHAAYTSRSLNEEQWNAEYIAACSPSVVLSLLAALDEGERREQEQNQG